jgi:hypothetical protein
MKRIISISVLVACLALPALAYAKKSTYVVTNRRLNYVKLVEVKAKDAEERNITHPVDIPEQKMREILASLKLSKGHLLSDKVDSREIYDEKAIDFLASALSRAFRDAQPNEEVQFSYVVKNPYFILRNDRLTMVDAWVSGNELFLEFRKLYAKLTGDTDKRGYTSKTVNRARGLRVSLELGPGQTMAAVGSKTMIVNLAQDYSMPKPMPATDETAVKQMASNEHTTTSSAAVAAPAADETTRRLEKIDMLRKRGLISNKEYKQKKAEILKDL